MNNVNLKEKLKEFVDINFGDLSKLSEDPKENFIKRSELFLSFYEAGIDIFERDIEPVVQGQLVEKKGVKLNLVEKK